jgi:hypothetical protein
MDLSWVSTGCAVIAAGAAIFATIRNRGQDSDTHVDERIKLAVGVKLTEIESGIRELRYMIPSRDVQTQDGHRITTLQNQHEEMKRHVDSLFDRVRAIENGCAANGHQKATPNG